METMKGEQEGSKRTREELEDAFREVDAECRREPRTNPLASLWDRLYHGEVLPLDASTKPEPPNAQPGE